MPVLGKNLARRFRYGAAKHMAAYVSTIQGEILPVFSDLNNRAQRIADAEFDRLKSQPATDDSGDLSSHAEAAQESGEVYYAILDALRRTSLTLYAVGLFHLLEQRLADLCRDASFGVDAPTDTKLQIVAKWYLQHFGLNLSALPSWATIDELRLLANAAKHGAGKSADDLRRVRPDLFEDPRIRQFFPDSPEIYTTDRVSLPLAGEDIFVSEDAFADFGASAFEFTIEIAKYFEEKSDNHFFDE